MPSAPAASACSKTAFWLLLSVCGGADQPLCGLASIALMPTFSPSPIESQKGELPLVMTLIRRLPSALRGLLNASAALAAVVTGASVRAAGVFETVPVVGLVSVEALPPLLGSQPVSTAATARR